jgi:hypothetical protein
MVDMGPSEEIVDDEMLGDSEKEESLETSSSSSRASGTL